MYKLKYNERFSFLVYLFFSIPLNASIREPKKWKKTDRKGNYNVGQGTLWKQEPVWGVTTMDNAGKLKSQWF